MTSAILSLVQSSIRRLAPYADEWQFDRRDCKCSFCKVSPSVYKYAVQSARGKADGDNLSLPRAESTSVTWLKHIIAGICRFYQTGRFREHGGLSGVCRSRLSYSGIHKHLLKSREEASELDTIRGRQQQTRSD